MKSPPLIPPSSIADSTSAMPPQHLVMEPADSAMQAYFGGEASVLSKFAEQPDSATRQFAFPLPKDSVFLAQIRQLWSKDARELAWRQEAVPYHPEGIAGDPAPYTFRTDDFVTSTLLLSFLLMVWVLANSWRFLRDIIKDFFYQRTRANLFTDRADTVLRGRTFLTVQACFLHGILFFDYTQQSMPEVFEQVSPYTLLGASTAAFLIYYFGKVTSYRAINNTFFATERNKQWDNHLFVSILATGCALLPLTLLVVYFELPFRYTLMAYVLLIAIIKTLLFYKCYRIFFSSLLGKVQIMLYFCALEIVPAAILWFLLIMMNQGLAALS